MADNLKSIVDFKNEVLDPDGGPESVLVVNHNDLEDRIIKTLGRYTGFPFLAKRDVPVDSVIPTGSFYWGINSMNSTTEFTITISGKTIDGNGFLPVFNVLKADDIVKYKDFEGRAAIFKIISKASLTDSGSNPYYTLNVVGYTDNPNYTFSINEQQPTFIEFLIKSASGQNLQQTLENGSQGILINDGTNSSVNPLIAVYSSDMTKGSAITIYRDFVQLQSASPLFTGTNTLFVGQTEVVLELDGQRRFSVDESNTEFHNKPASYFDEETLRPLMVSDKFIPSVGKVKEIINESIVAGIFSIFVKGFQGGVPNEGGVIEKNDICKTFQPTSDIPDAGYFGFYQYNGVGDDQDISNYTPVTTNYVNVT